MELELKYRVPDEPHLLAKLLEDPHLVPMRPFAVVPMRAVYYDAPGLAELGGVLRLRREGETSVLTYKGARRNDPDTLAHLFARDEWNVAAPALDLPRLVQEGAPQALLALSGWTPVCEIAFSRTAAACRDNTDDNTVFEFALDTGTLSADGKSEPFCEVEMELLSGSPDVLCAFAEIFAKTYNLSPEHETKYARALQLLRKRPA